MFKVSGVLIIFHEVMKLQNFECDVSDFILAIVHNISPLVFWTHGVKVLWSNLCPFFSRTAPKIFYYQFFLFFLREVRVSSNLKSDSRNFVKTSFSWGFWAKMDQNEVFLVLQKTQCVEFFWFFCLKLQQSAFWEKSCFKSSKWDFQVLWKIVSQNVPDFFCKVTIENKLKIDLSDFFARKILFSRFLGKSGPINDPEWFFS